MNLEQQFQKLYDSWKASDKKLLAKVDALDNARKQGVKDLDGIKSNITDLAVKTKKALAELQDMQQKLGRTAFKTDERIESLGSTITQSDAFKRFLKTHDKVKISHKLSHGVQQKAVTSVTATGLVVPDYQPGIITPPTQRFFLRDVLAQGRTTSSTIHYVEETVFTNSAAPVAEGALKPESNLEFEPKTANVQTIAHWIAVSKQILDDVPALLSYIDARMTYGLKIEEEQQLLFGDGTGNNLLGIMPQATEFTPALITDLAVTNAQAADTIAAAILQVQQSLYYPSAIVLNPLDWWRIQLLKDTTGNYLFANPQYMSLPQLWSLPVIQTPAMPVDNFLVGAFNIGAQIFDREDAVTELFIQDVDNVRRNMLTIRTEERLALAVYRPQAFVKGTFTAPEP